MTRTGMKTRMWALGLAGITAAGALMGAAAPAQAGEKSETMWRLLTYGGAGTTVYGAAKKNILLTVLGAGGTYMAHRQWKKEIKKRHHEEARSQRAARARYARRKSPRSKRVRRG